MAYDITSGAVLDGIELKSDKMNISSGGIANSTTLMTGGSVYVSSGGFASNTVNQYGEMVVSSGGSADVLKQNHGSVTILSGGELTNVDALGGGITVSSGGMVSGAVFSGCSLHLYAGASYYDVTMSKGTFLNGFKLNNSSSFDSTEEEGWSISDDVVVSLGMAYLYANQIANSTTVDFAGDIYIYSGGVANDTMVDWGGCVNILSGGVANSTTVNGSMYIYSGGVANSTTMNGEGTLYVAAMYISSGGVANDTTVNRYGNMSISSGGVASSTIVDYMGEMCISSGGLANSVNLTSGTLYVEGGIAFDVTVSSAASAFVSRGGVIEKAKVSGGMLYVSNGASAQIDYWQPCFGSVVYDYESATVSFASQYEGVWYLNSKGVPVNTETLENFTAAGPLYVMSGGITNQVELTNGSKFIWNTGVANDTTIFADGNLHISSGGVASNAKVTSGGSLFVSMGGSAIDIDWDPCVGHLTIKNGAVVTFKNSYSGAYLGSDNTLISSGSLLAGKQISYGGSVYAMSDGVISSGTMSGTMYVFNGGKAEQVEVTGGNAHIYSGGVANSTTVKKDGDMYIYSGGVANSTTVNSSGYMYIYSGGVANSTTVNSWGDMYISSGGVANDTTVNFLGDMYISSGGVANSTVISSGNMHIYTGGVANDTIVNSVGYMYISSGGVANDTTLNESGYMFISSDGVHRGTLNISGGYVSAYNGVIDFTVAEAAPEGGYLINDLSRIYGAPTYTITVKEDQAEGIYYLAQGASNFTGTVTIVSSLTSFTNITVNGDTVTLNDIKYTLKQNDGNLCLLVGEVSIIDKPTYTLTPADSWAKEVVITVVFDAESTLNEYAVGDGSWQTCEGNTITVKENGTIQLRSKDANGFYSKVETVNINNIDKDNPTIEVSAGNPDTYVGKVTVAITANDSASGIAKIEYSLDNSNWQTLEGETYEATQNGTVYFRAVDKVGNVSDVKNVQIDKIDTDKPVLTVEGTPTEVTEESVVLSVTASDATSGIDKVEYSIDGGEYQSVTLDQGKGSITVEKNAVVNIRAYDKAGQVAEETVTIDKIEKDAPVITFTATPNSWTNAGVVIVSASATDDASGVKVIQYYDGSQWVDGSSVEVTENNTTVLFRAEDNSGKSTEKSYTVDFIDRTDPVVVITGNNTTELTKEVTLVIEATDADSKIAFVKYSFDNQTWQTVEENKVVVNSNKTVYFIVEDNAGNSVELSETITRIDNDAPVLNITGNAENYQTEDVILKATAIDNNPGEIEISYSLDNKQTWITYSDAAHCVVTSNQTVYFKAVDSVGNVTEKTIVVSKIDKDDPVLSITAYTGALTNQKFYFSVKSSDASSPIVSTQYSIGDTGVWKNCSGNMVSVSERTTVHFKTTDSVGNTTVKTFDIDKMMPVVSSDITTWTNTNVNVSAVFNDSVVLKQYSFDGITFMQYSSAVEMTENGKVYFSTTDSNGNVLVSEYVVSNIDKVAPVISVSGVSDVATRRRVTVTASATDDASGIAAIEYSFDAVNWIYGGSVEFKSNGKVVFRVTDAAGNSSYSTAVVANILEGSADSNLLANGTSQIVGFDAASGKVGFVAVDGETSPQWQGVWEWSGSDIDTWRVAGVGKFAGSNADTDGILLQNVSNNTFAAWTDLGSGDYGYVSLAYVDGNFSAAAIANIGGSSAYDDILITDDKGNFGVVLDGTDYRDICHVNEGETATWELCGVGNFGKPGETLIVRNTKTNHLTLWANNDITFETWDWSTKTIGFLGYGYNSYEFAAVGDFFGDGIDDIILRNPEDNSIWMWEDGNSKNTKWLVTPESGFKIEAVGDYNGDGKDDLLVREYNTGWGGLGYYAFGGDQLWNDLNARVETDFESKFSIIA